MMMMMMIKIWRLQCIPCWFKSWRLLWSRNTGLQLYPHPFGDGTGEILLLKCLGAETSLADCYNSGWGQHDCEHDEDVAVTCVNNELVPITGNQKYILTEFKMSAIHLLQGSLMTSRRRTDLDTRQSRRHVEHSQLKYLPRCITMSVANQRGTKPYRSHNVIHAATNRHTFS